MPAELPGATASLIAAKSLPAGRLAAKAEDGATASVTVLASTGCNKTTFSIAAPQINPARQENEFRICLPCRNLDSTNCELGVKYGFTLNNQCEKQFL